MHILPVPTELDPATTLHEEDLELIPETDVGGVLGPGDPPVPPPPGERGLLVSIGRPVSWPLTKLVSVQRSAAISGQRLSEAGDLTELRQALIKYFGEEELRDLCFDLEVDYELLPGKALNKRSLARDLINHFDRLGRISELVDACRQQRPNIFQLLLPTTDQNPADYCLVLLACSFQPRPDIRVEWARFTIYLHSPDDDTGPIAFDIHPLEVFDKTQRQVKVAITPKFKFSQLEADLGSAGIGLQYDLLEPVVIGAGLLQPNPSWTFERTKGRQVVGSKFMHLIVKRPRGEGGIRASFEIIAEISKPGQYLWPVRTRERDKAHRTAMICGT